MGLFYFGDKPTNSAKLYGVSTDFLHRSECQVCPLNNIASNCNPHMPPSGTDKPLIYFLGEAPGRQEDEQGKPFVGDAGEVLRFRVPRSWLRDIRMSNTVRTRPPQNREPTEIEIECCRPSVEKDIEATKPAAIFGFGNVPLYWALRRRGIMTWNGRRFPIKVRTHTCWYYAMVHPSAVGRSRRFDPRYIEEYGSETEFVFSLDLERAFREVDEGLPTPTVHTVETAKETTTIVTGANPSDVDRVVEFLDWAQIADYSGLDIETNMLKPYRKDAQILTVALSNEHGTLSFPLYHEGACWSDKDFKIVENSFIDYLYKAEGSKVQFSPFEMEWLAYFYGYGVIRAGRWDDAQSQAYILDERRGGLSLEFLCLQHYGLDIKAISNTDRKNLAKTPVDTVLRYNAIDAKYHYNLALDQFPLIDERGLADVYEHQIERTQAAVFKQAKGIPVNQDEAIAFHNKYCKRLDEIEAEIDTFPEARKFKDITKRPYRPSSVFDVKRMFNVIMDYNIPNGKEEALLEVDHPLAALTIDWRKHSKVLSTNIKPALVGARTLFDDGLLHPTLNTTATRTWRTSAEDINDQNFPKYGQGKEVRRMIYPGGDIRVVSFDYAGIQARNVAMESKDEALIRAFWKRYNIHKDWLERIVRQCPYFTDEKRLATDKDFFSEQRHRAKNKFVFPSFFGAQPSSLAGYLNIDENDARALHEEFWNEFPDIKGWHQFLKEQYYELGYVSGLSGFRRRAPISINELINSPIQADESKIVLDAMIRLSKFDDPRFVSGVDDFTFQANMEIHDDLTFLWPKHEIERNAEIVIDTMLDVPFEWAHIVPIEVEMSVGKDWHKMEEVGAYATDTWKPERFSCREKIT